MIPKIMHFSMQSRCVPRDLLRTLNRWETQLPEHSIFFHDDDAVDRLLSMDWSEFPGFHEGMKCVLYRGAMTIDIWRVLMLWKYGGLYSDIDNWPEDMFTESLIPGNVSAWFLTDSHFRLLSGSWLWNLVIQSCMKR
jgi:mannosyltransferase OCH1-like enzyme